MDDSIEVEVNLLESNKTKKKNDNRRVKEEAQASTISSSADIRLDMMMKAMEMFMDRLYVDDRIQNPNRE